MLSSRYRAGVGALDLSGQQYPHSTPHSHAFLYSQQKEEWPFFPTGPVYVTYPDFIAALFFFVESDTSAPLRRLLKRLIKVFYFIESILFLLCVYQNLSNIQIPCRFCFAITRSKKKTRKVIALMLMFFLAITFRLR